MGVLVKAGSGRSQRTLLRFAIGLLSLSLLGLCVRYGGLLFGGHRAIGQTDLLGYYSAGRLVLEGHAHSLYDLGMLQRAQEAAIRPLRMQDPVLPYLAPPYFALLLAPMALFPYAVAYVLWLIFNFLLLGGTVFALRRYSLLDRSQALICGVALLAFVPIVLGLAQGQVAVLILALLAGSFFALRNRRDGLAGLLLAFALIKPPYVIPCLIVLAVHGRWRAVGSFALTALTLCLAPLALMGASINQTYLHTLIDVTKMQGQSNELAFHHVAIASATYDPHVNYSLAAAVQLLLHAPASTITSGVLILLALLALVRYSKGNSSIEGPLGLAVIVGVLVNPHVLAHDLVLLLVAVGVALRWRERVQRSLATVLAVGYLAIEFGGFVQPFTHLQLATLAVLGFCVWFLATTGPRDATAGFLSPPQQSVAGSYPRVGAKSGSSAIPSP